jgi:hypothetical protein
LPYPLDGILGGNRREKTMKHTPGPWKTNKNIGRKGELGVVADSAPCIICIMGNADAWPVEAQDNARLISACPDMYEALSWIVRCVKARGPAGTTVYFISDEKMEAAKAAIRKGGGIMKELTKEDWVEIYYALEAKAAWTEDVEGDEAWTLHLREIMGKIGPDGENMIEA